MESDPEVGSSLSRYTIRFVAGEQAHCAEQHIMMLRGHASVHWACSPAGKLPVLASSIRARSPSLPKSSSCVLLGPSRVPKKIVAAAPDQSKNKQPVPGLAQTPVNTNRRRRQTPGPQPKYLSGQPAPGCNASVYTPGKNYPTCHIQWPCQGNEEAPQMSYNCMWLLHIFWQKWS